MFRVCPMQDMITFLVVSIDQIIHNKHLSKIDFGNLLFLANFISGTTYRKDPFTNAKEIRTFFRKASKYSTIISDNKHELKHRQPYDLVKHIMKMQKTYTFPVGISQDYKLISNTGNQRQVFEYIFSKSTKERLQSYKDVFIRLRKCEIHQPTDLFNIYYFAQQYEHNLISAWENMLVFLESENISIEKHRRIIPRYEKYSLSFLQGQD